MVSDAANASYFSCCILRGGCGKKLPAYFVLTKECLVCHFNPSFLIVALEVSQELICMWLPWMKAIKINSKRLWTHQSLRNVYIFLVCPKSEISIPKPKVNNSVNNRNLFARFVFIFLINCNHLQIDKFPCLSENYIVDRQAISRKQTVSLHRGLFLQTLIG